MNTGIPLSQPPALQVDLNHARLLLEQVMHHGDVVMPHMLTWAECAALQDLYRLITGAAPR